MSKRGIFTPSSDEPPAQYYVRMYNEVCVVFLNIVTLRPDLDLTQFLVVVDKQWTAHCRQMVCFFYNLWICIMFSLTDNDSKHLSGP